MINSKHGQNRRLPAPTNRRASGDLPSHPGRAYSLFQRGGSTGLCNGFAQWRRTAQTDLLCSACAVSRLALPVSDCGSCQGHRIRCFSTDLEKETRGCLSQEGCSLEETGEAHPAFQACACPLFTRMSNQIRRQKLWSQLAEHAGFPGHCGWALSGPTPGLQAGRKVSWAQNLFCRPLLSQGSFL